jgi:hypothetical protein
MIQNEFESSFLLLWFRVVSQLSVLFEVVMQIYSTLKTSEYHREKHERSNLNYNINGLPEVKRFFHRNWSKNLLRISSKISIAPERLNL